MRFGELLGWRWTPAVALVGGSLLFVLLAVTLVPDQVGQDFGATSGSARGRFASPPGSATPHAGGSAQPGVTSRTPRTLRDRRPHGPGGPGGLPSPMQHQVESPFGTPGDAPHPEPPPAAPAPFPAAPPSDPASPEPP